MWLRLRKTASRGRAISPSMRRRIRSWRLRRAAPRLATCVILIDLGFLLLAADLAGLAGLPADDFAGVSDALALVGLRLPAGADLGRHLPDELLVDPHDGQTGGILHLEGDPVRGLDLDLVAVAQAELQLPADERRPVADAGDLEALAVARGHPDDHVVDERAGQPVELLVHLLLARAGDDERALLPAEEHVRVELPAERALGALDGHAAAVDLEVDAGGHGNGQTADSGHLGLPDVGQDFAAELGLVGLRAGHDPLARADDDDPEAAEDAGDVGLAGVDAQPRLADPLQPGHDRHLAVDVPELDLDHVAGPGLLLGPAGDEALGLEDAGDLALRPGRRHDHLLVAGPRRVADSREHVRDRIGDGHRCPTSSTS